MMDLNRYNADDIHEMRLVIEERYSKMTKEEAEADFRQRVKRAEELMDKLRKKREAAV